MVEARFGIGDSDRDRILNFVSETRNFIAEIIDEDGGQGLYFVSSLHPPMRAAWESVDERFEELSLDTQNADKTALSSHGLIGDELAFKLAVVNYRWSNFQSFRNLPQGEKSRAIENSYAFPLWISERIELSWIYLRWLLKMLLEAVDKLLSSILDAVGATGAIGEFKDFVESAIDTDGVAEATAS